MLLQNFRSLSLFTFVDVTEYRGECIDTHQCAWLLGKHLCSNGECICDEGYRWYRGKCIPKNGLNEECTADIDCYNGYDIFAMVCASGVCSCSSGYYLRGDYDCRPSASGRNLKICQL